MWGLAVIFGVGAALIAFLLYFNRDPARSIPAGSNVISPADGTVIDILDLEGLEDKPLVIKKGILGKIRTTAEEVGMKSYLISIFMNLNHVHVQRAPVDGKVLKVYHSHGSYRCAWNLDALENEKTEIVLKHSKLGNIKVIQIAGFVARRIESWVKRNQEIQKGQRIGKIHLGSQVCVLIPKKHIRLTVQKGDPVIAGETIIAEIK